MCAQSSTVRCVEMVDSASPFGVDHKWRWVKQISAARSINRRHSQTWPKRSLKYLARRCSCLFNGASLFFSSSSTHRQKLIQYLFRVRASQNYHHPLCATCKGPSPKKKEKLYILLHHIKLRRQARKVMKVWLLELRRIGKSPSFVWCRQTKSWHNGWAQTTTNRLIKISPHRLSLQWPIAFRHPKEIFARLNSTFDPITQATRHQTAMHEE